MHRLCTLLGMPQHRFASIHVVGTNGKSSVTRMTAALLEAHGISTGACVSPHPLRWSERVLLQGQVEIGPEAFAAAVGRTAEAAAVVNRGLEEGEEVTQFEVATAAAFVALAAARIEVAVVEAGLGGRLDATNTIPSRVTALTSVGLDHTDWLGETELEIAAEKLAVLRDATTLVTGRLDPDVAALAEQTAAERGAELIDAAEDPGPEARLRAAGPFQRRNFTLAMAVANAYLASRGRPPDGLDPERVAGVAESLTVPGRLEQVAAEPPTFVDVAHNPDGAAALAEALPGVLAAGSGRSSSRIPETSTTSSGAVVGVLAILADKDAEGIVAALAPALDRVVCTDLRGAHRPSMPAAGLLAVCESVGPAAEAEADFDAALARARALAREKGTVLVTGSHYVLGPVRAALS
jgi:dihydrofolate synthase/folylpolyglutamate synthase